MRFSEEYYKSLEPSYMAQYPRQTWARFIKKIKEDVLELFTENRKLKRDIEVYKKTLQDLGLFQMHGDNCSENTTESES